MHPIPTLERISFARTPLALIDPALADSRRCAERLGLAGAR
jgi:hypothetical protein